MKALVISRLGGPEVLELRDMPDPAPRPGQELVAGADRRIELRRHHDRARRLSRNPQASAGRWTGVLRPATSDGQRVMGYTQWGAFADSRRVVSICSGPSRSTGAAEEGAAFPVNYFTAYFAYWKAGLLEPAFRQERAF